MNLGAVFHLEKLKAGAAISAATRQLVPPHLSISAAIGSKRMQTIITWTSISTMHFVVLIKILVFQDEERHLIKEEFKWKLEE